MNLVTISRVTTSILEHQGQRVVTTKQLAEFYGCTEKNIADNYQNNDERFEAGKHFVKLEGDALKQFKSSLPDIVGEPLKFAPSIILWFEKGAARHAKMLSTEKAWEVFEELEDSYFRVKSSGLTPPIPNFEDPYEAALAWAEQFKQKQIAQKAEVAAIEQRDQAIATKALIGSKREATAMATASKAIKHANRLEVELDQSKNYATVKRMERVHGRAFDWRLLKKTTKDIGLVARDVFDANYGSVKAYPAEVWEKTYSVKLLKLAA